MKSYSLSSKALGALRNICYGRVSLMEKNLARLTVLFCAIAFALPFNSNAATNSPRVLVISVDGMHAIDLALFVKKYPNSTMARLVGTGYNYTSASTPKPSDSLPGNLALCTGGSPLSTGVFYDRSYDRSLWPPNTFSGPTGTPVLFDESADIDSTALNGGGGLNTNALPRDPARGGAPVYPHNYVRVNTTFEVVKAAGYHTAWIDKHLSDEIVNGPSGLGVDDLWTPEIAANFPYQQSGAPISINKAVDSAMWYDNLKVQAILNEIAGLDHTGSNNVGVPTLFGLNFQALSVAQKLAKNNRTNDGGNASAPFRIGGYYDGLGTPSMNVSNALLNTDLGLSNIVAALQANNLFNWTYIVLTSKHGQGPMDTNRFTIVSPNVGSVSNMLGTNGIVVAMQTADTSSLVWLADQSKAAQAVGVLTYSNTLVTTNFLQDVWSGEKLKLLYGDPATDPRVPDVIAWARPGVIYTTKSSTFAEHGGYSDQETIVPIVISNPNLAPQTFKNPVTIMQVAPTVLQLLNLSPFALQAVQIEHTPVLPGFDAAQLALNPIAPSLGYNGVSVVHLTNGQAQFQIAAAQQKTFAVQASSDLTNWTSIATNTLFLGAVTNVTDTQASNYVNRFYRAVSLP